MRRVNLDEEGNVPTLFNALLLLMSAVLLAVQAYASRCEGNKFAANWGWLAVIFAFLSIDEGVELHGFFSELARLQIGGSHIRPWVLVYGVLLIVLGIAYIRFLVGLSSTTRKRFFWAAGVYLFGAFGMEIVGSVWAGTHGEQNWTYGSLTTVEEVIEMGGLILFIRALLLHNPLRLTFGSARQA
jgi:hypothetical protein